MSYKDVSRQIAEVAVNYQYQKPPEIVLQIQEFFRKVSQWLWELFDSLHIKAPVGTDSRSFSGFLQIAVWIAGILAVLALVWFIWTRIKSSATSRAATTRGAASVEEILDAAGLKKQAAEQARQRQFKAACRSLYLSFLQLLHEREIAPFSPAKTNYEYLYLFGKHESLKAPFRSLADIVELVWFGTKTAEEADYAGCLKELEQLEVQVATICEARKPQEVA